MAPSVSVRPLPDEATFVNGYYGLSPASVRGLVRLTALDRWSVRVKHLRVYLRGKQTCSCQPSYEVVNRERTLFSEIYADLLENEILPPETILDIPFDLPFPDAPEDYNRPPTHAYPSATPYFLPASSHLLGVTNRSYPYEAHTVYELHVELQELPSTFYRPGPRTASERVEGFVVYDPRLIPRILHPETRQWRSAPRAYPCEYDVDVQPTVLGPGDDLHFNYRVSISSDAANEGIRIKRVRLLLREHHLVGDNRGSYVRGVLEILRWEQNEGPDAHPVMGGYELAELRPRSEMIVPKNRMSLESDGGSVGTDSGPGPSRRSLNSFDDHAGSSSSRRDLGDAPMGLNFSNDSVDSQPRRHHFYASYRPSLLPRLGGYGGGGDGLYAETEVVLRIPSRGGFYPTTPRSNEEPLPDHDIQTGQTPARIDVKHSIQITIELEGAEKIVVECGCCLTSVGKKECAALLESEPHLVPTLDYDKVVGGEVWHPPYSEHQSDFDIAAAAAAAALPDPRNSQTRRRSNPRSDMRPDIRQNEQSNGQPSPQSQQSNEALPDEMQSTRPDDEPAGRDHPVFHIEPLDLSTLTVSTESTTPTTATTWDRSVLNSAQLASAGTVDLQNALDDRGSSVDDADDHADIDDSEVDQDANVPQSDPDDPSRLDGALNSVDAFVPSLDIPNEPPPPYSP
ncbi:uncharacterized protein BJ171DRAFT_137120 [Polychytrium aggregatum]|uniref:uncharacterized protein n=1 Tax=Polychytrium aggregatum TaxID=110093 RepID=UPI0022FEF5C0|nr:uncharacterized protein BJ171DRAFT_137120 [Polychytrium aggregatum]KAI9203587.1 hypothetical protein BJ171DRAFT_137120 [Polychytrium aggregatum]